MNFIPDFIIKSAQTSESIQSNFEALFKAYYDLHLSYEKAISNINMKKISTFTSLKSPSNSERIVGILYLLLFSPLD